MRLVLLDTPDYRDATAALLLAARVLGDEKIVRRAGEAIEQLLVMRGSERYADAKPLWAPAYRLTGEPTDKFPELPYAIDTIASRHAMQTLLAACLLGAAAPDPADSYQPIAEASGPALVAAAKAFGALPRRAREPARFYDLIDGKPLTEAPPDAGPGPFDPPESPAERADRLATAEVLLAAREIETGGLAKFLAAAGSETATFRPSQRVAILLSGLGEGVLAVQSPRTAAEAAAYVQSRESTWVAMNGSAPDSLAGRLERLYLLLVRAKVESVR